MLITGILWKDIKRHLYTEKKKKILLKYQKFS